MELQELGERSERYLDWVDAVGKGELVSRAVMAQRMKSSYGNARYHLDNAVRLGMLNRARGWIGNQVGWLYARPETMPRFEGM